MTIAPSSSAGADDCPSTPAGQEAHRHDASDDNEHADKGHSDITATYQFTCDAPGKLETLHVGLFDAFPAIDALTVQYISDGRQGAATLNSDKTVLAF